MHPAIAAIAEDPESDLSPLIAVREQLDLEIQKIDGWRQTMDVYARPLAEAAARPALLWLHGGGWASGTPRGPRRTARFLAWRSDLVVCSASYRLTDRARFPAQIHDAADALRWLRLHADELGLDPTRIAVAGDSAGGYLSAMLALTHDDPALAGGGRLAGSARPQALLVHWGPLDFIARWYGRGGTPGAEGGMLGRIFTEDPTLYHRASALSHGRADAPPALFVQGRHDETVHQQQGELGQACWQAFGCTSELLLLDWIGHGATDPADEARARNAAHDFLQRHLAARENPDSRPWPQA
jgi:acetyl esterase/lipase